MKLTQFVSSAVVVATITYLGLMPRVTDAAEVDNLAIDLALLRKHGVDADTEGIRAMLGSLLPSEEQARTVQALIQQLGDDSFTKREAAMAALIRMPALPVDTLRAALNGHDGEVRWRAEKVLGSREGELEMAKQPLLFAAYRLVYINSMKGLEEEIKSTLPLCDRPAVKLAARLALDATTGKSDPSTSPASWSDFLDSYVVHGESDGVETAFVRQLPEILLEQLPKDRRKANTFGSVTSRHDSATWLYPIRGKNEIPRVFQEDDKRWYPIWGTWRQRRDNWYALDENGRYLDDKAGGGRVHYESEVQFVVVHAGK